MERPETSYVAVGDSDVAYKVLGDGPLDLLYCYCLGSHVELLLEIPGVAEFLNKLAAFSRLIIFDRRGSGASDGIPRNAMPTWEEWTEDILAVMDGAGSKRTAIVASGDAYHLSPPKSSWSEACESLTLSSSSSGVRATCANEIVFSRAFDASDDGRTGLRRCIQRRRGAVSYQP
jgi:hypothetical protein